MNTMPKARNFIVAEEEMSRTKFYDVYRPRYYIFTECITDGRIGLTLKDGKVVLNVREALKAIWPNCTINDVSVVRDDLFA